MNVPPAPHACTAAVTQDDAPAARPSWCSACSYTRKQLSYSPAPVHVAGCRESGPATPAEPPGPTLTGASSCHCGRSVPAVSVLRIALYARRGWDTVVEQGLCQKPAHRDEAMRLGTVLAERSIEPAPVAPA